MRRALLFCCALLIPAGCYHLPSRESYKPLVIGDEQLKQELEKVRKKFKQPAMAAALIRGDQIIARGVTGHLVYGGNDEALLRHRFHIGSTTKPFTSLLIALLIKDGRLHYDSTLDQLLPGIKMAPGYKNVTVHDLLLSRAGIIPFQRADIEDPAVVEMLTKTIPAKEKDPQAQRKLMTTYALSRKPIHEPGTRSVYSNVSWAILGYIAETVTGKTYEQLVRERIFQPLGMKGARFGGWPASKNDPHQPRGHYADPQGPRPQPLDDEYVFPDWMNPAGGIHCTIMDYALFVREVLQGLQGKGKLLPESMYREIHSIQTREKISVMYQGANQRGEIPLGYGWGLLSVDKAMISVADGSGGTFYARLAVLPELDLAFAGFTNSGDGEPALSEITRRITGLPW